MRYYRSDYLCHHGIAGQKWGVQNGPPYPLDSDVHNSVVAKSKTDGSSYTDSEKIERVKTKTNKRLLLDTISIIGGGALAVGPLAVGFISPGAILAGASMVGYGVKDLVSGIREGNSAVKKLSQFYARRSEEKIDKKTGLPISKEKYSIEEDLKEVNAYRLTGDRDSNYNCVNCTVAYDMRRRGFDVMASEKSTGRTVQETLDLYGAKDITKKFRCLNLKRIVKIVKRARWILV